MLSFLKNNIYNIFKLFLIQIGMTVFGLMLAMATASNKTLLIVSGIFSVLFYMYLLYSQVWELGAKDQIKLEHESIKPMPLKGLYLSGAANVINVILALLIIISFLNIPRLASGELTPSQLSSGNLTGETVTSDIDDTEAAEEWRERNVREYEAFLAETPDWAMNLYQISSALFGFLNGMYTGLITAFAPDNPVFKLLTVIPALLICTVGYYVGTKGIRLLPQIGGKKKTPAEPVQWGNNLHKD